MKEDYEIIAEYEGLSIEEAKLTLAQRLDLPIIAFCGPERTYPANDGKNVRKSLKTLSKMFDKIPENIAITIYHNLKRKAEKYKVDVPSIKGEKMSKDKDEKREEELLNWVVEESKVSETKEVEIEKTGDPWIDWLFEIEEAKKPRLWMQKAVKKKGALRSQLGIKEGKTIPMSILVKIKNAEVGSTVTFRGKKLKVTAQLKKRAVLAITFIKKGGKKKSKK